MKPAANTGAAAAPAELAGQRNGKISLLLFIHMMYNIRRINLEASVLYTNALLTDLYQLTMMQGLFLEGKHEQYCVFDRYYRSNPFNGGYTVVAGLEHLIDYVSRIHFSDDDIDYLKQTGIFCDEFLEYLRTWSFTGDIYAMPEGTVAFPQEVLLRVHAKKDECLLLETCMSMIMNHESLIATKARRVRTVAGKDALMEKLHLMNGPYLTNAAMLLFSKDPEKWQLGAYVKIGYFETDADLLYQDEIHGSILEQIDKIVELVYLKYMRAKITYEGMQRIERFFVPEEALREALLNALGHKQYQSGVPIQISVYEDKLYIANCGCLPENWTLENLMSKHASSPYNPNIAHVFYLAGFIESWGRGIEKICSACEKDGVPQPEYTINPGDIMIKFTAPEDRLIRSVTGRVTEKVTDKVTDTLDETSLKILNLLAVDPAYTTTFLAENLSLSRKTVSLRLKMLKDAGLIERIGSDRKGYWKLLK